MKGSTAIAGTIMAVGLLGGSALVAAAGESAAPTASSDVASDFVRPFDYVIPEGWAPNVVYSHPPLAMFAEADPGWAFGDLQHSGSRGILVADVTSVWVHGCPPSASYLPVGGEGASAFLTDVQAMGGLDFEDLTVTKVDGHQAIEALSLSSGRCGVDDIHIEGLPSFEDYIDLGIPSRLTVADIDGRSILVQVWAGSEFDLEEFLPIADEFIDSIHFVDQDT
jgi:hypothetical protein